MAAKRFLDNPNGDQDQPNEKRPRTNGPAIFSVIGKALVQNSFQGLCSSLEPMLRRVVSEEVNNSLRRNSNLFTRSPSFRLQALEPASLRLVFPNKLPFTIFTGSKIQDIDNAQLKVYVVNMGSQDMLPVPLPHPVKIEIVVLDGDFPGDDTDSWTSEQFNKNVVKERQGKRPLVTGDLLVTMREGNATVGDLEFTDNSSWIRSRKFRIGARVVPGSYQGVRIREGMTDAFVVKDHRGELYKKHYPPKLGDEVWRLEKIGKDGAFHKRLESAGINSVQDFLKLFVVDPKRLREILGGGMSEKMWKATVEHARTCDMGKKLYISRGLCYVIFLTPICQIVRAIVNGHVYSTQESMTEAQVQRWVRQAYDNWNSLQEVDGSLNEPALLTQGEEGDQYAGHPAFQQNSYMADAAIDVGYLPGNMNSECNDLHINPASITSIQGIQFTISGSTSDGDLIPKSFIGGDYQ